PLSHFLPHLGLGYALWRFMVMILNDSTSVMRGSRAFILDGSARLTDFALRSTAKASFYFGATMLVVLGVLVWSPEISDVSILTLLITLPVVYVNVVWVGYVVGVLGARFPDLGEMITTALMAGFLFTPILWEGERFPAGTISGLIVRANPAYHILGIVRAPVFGRMPELASIYYVVALTVLGWVLASFVCRRYSRYVPIWV